MIVSAVGETTELVTALMHSGCAVSHAVLGSCRLAKLTHHQR
jgi:hypothetical protein